MLQRAITAALETNEKMKNLSKVILKESKGNYKTKKYNNQNKILSMGSTVEWKC